MEQEKAAQFASHRVIMYFIDKTVKPDHNQLLVPITASTCSAAFHIDGLVHYIFSLHS